MEELIQKLEKLEGPDRYADEAIALARGLVPEGDGWVKSGPQTWHKNLRWEPGCKFDASYQPPNYTASLDAALTLVPEGWGWLIDGGHPPAGYVVELDEGKLPPKQITGIHKSPAIALCIAALKARAHKGGEG